MDILELGQFIILDRNLKIEDLTFQEIINFVYVNFDKDSSIKIIPHFEKIKKKEFDELNIFFNNFNIKLRTDDYLGKLHFVVLKILLENSNKTVLLINNVGLTNASIDFLKNNFDKIMFKFKDKLILVT